MTSARFNSFCKLVISDDDVSMMVVILGIYSRISLGCTLLIEDSLSRSRSRLLLCFRLFFIVEGDS